jgi:hypothetical protein
LVREKEEPDLGEEGDGEKERGRGMSGVRRERGSKEGGGGEERETERSRIFERGGAEHFLEQITQNMLYPTNTQF